MNSVLNVQDIDTMSSCSWNTEKSLINAAEKSRGGGPGMLADHQPRSPSSNQTKYPIKTLCFSKKSLTMPTKEEYSILLTCGLGKYCAHLNAHFYRTKNDCLYDLIID